MDVKNKLKISDKPEGKGSIRWAGQRVDVAWKWETKLVETTEPQVYDLKKWDRVWLTFTIPSIEIPEEVICDTIPYSKELSGIKLLFAGVRETRISVSEEWELIIHLVGTVPTTGDASFTVELVHDGDLVASETAETVGATATFVVVYGGTYFTLTIDVTSADEDGATFDVSIDGEYEVCEIIPSETVPGETKTIYVQVPPSPAKLILRDVVDDVDVAVSADYVYPLITAPPRDNNRVVTDLWGEEDGILSYGRWYTEADGYVKSFKAFGPADPRYGSIVLPIAGWLNDTFHDNGLA